MSVPDRIYLPRSAGNRASEVKHDLKHVKANDRFTEQNIIQLPQGFMPIEAYLSSPSIETHEKLFADAQICSKSSRSARKQAIAQVLEATARSLSSNGNPGSQDGDTKMKDQIAQQDEEALGESARLSSKEGA